MGSPAGGFLSNLLGYHGVAFASASKKPYQSKQISIFRFKIELEIQFCTMFKGLTLVLIVVNVFTLGAGSKSPEAEEGEKKKKTVRIFLVFIIVQIRSLGWEELLLSLVDGVCSNLATPRDVVRRLHRGRIPHRRYGLQSAADFRMWKRQSPSARLDLPTRGLGSFGHRE